MADKILTQQYLHELYEYRDGVLYWKKNKGTAKAGDKVGSISSSNYFETKLNGKGYKNHRLIYMMFNGYMPDFIDHYDNNRLNNKIENLRECSVKQNAHNRAIQKNNSSGIKNVSWHKQMNKWLVSLRVNGKNKYFGYYNDVDYAKFVAEAMRYKYHGKFANNR